MKDIQPLEIPHTLLQRTKIINKDTIGEKCIFFKEIFQRRKTKTNQKI